MDTEKSAGEIEAGLEAARKEIQIIIDSRPNELQLTKVVVKELGQAELELWQDFREMLKTVDDHCLENSTMLNTAKALHDKMGGAFNSSAPVVGNMSCRMFRGWLRGAIGEFVNLPEMLAFFPAKIKEYTDKLLIARQDLLDETK